MVAPWLLHLGVPLAAGAASWLFSDKEKRQPQQTSMSSTTSAPPSWTQPLYGMASGELSNLYRSGVGGNVYQGPRVAPLSMGTQRAIGGLGNLTQQYNNPYLTSLVSSPTSSAMNLANIASGGDIGGNSNFQRVLDRALGRTAESINSAMSGMGRYGSGAHTGVLSEAMGDITANALANQYNRDIANMMAANQAIDASRMNQIQGAGQLYGGRANALMNALAASGIQDRYQQDILDAMRSRFREREESGWDRLNRLIGGTRTLSGDYGTRAIDQRNMNLPGNDPLANFLSGLVFPDRLLSGMGRYDRNKEDFFTRLLGL